MASSAGYNKMFSRFRGRSSIATQRALAWRLADISGPFKGLVADHARAGWSPPPSSPAS